MLLYFIVYFAMGLVIDLGLGLIILIKVIKKGYDLYHFYKFIDGYAEYCYSYVCEDCGEMYYSKYRRIIGTLWGYLIWPIRLFENRHFGQEIINMFEKHLKESE